ncbi:hypothetical protein JCM11641_008223 [Rhodosporidiobolus odoratus]
MVSQSNGPFSLAQRRALATPAELDTAAASGRQAAAGSLSPKQNGPFITSYTDPTSTYRRRASLVGPESPNFTPPSPRAAPIHPLSPRADASFHLQQARTSMVPGQERGEPQQHARKRSLFGGGGTAGSAAPPGSKRLSQASHPPAAPSSTFRLGSTFAASRNSRPSLTSTVPSDPILTINPSDTRRPSFLATAAHTATTYTPSPSRFLFLLFPSRRMQKSLRLLSIAAIALFLFIKLLNAGLPTTKQQEAIRQSAKLAQAGQLEQLPLSLTEHEEVWSNPSVGPQSIESSMPRVVAVPPQSQRQAMQRPFSIEVGAPADEGERVEAELARKQLEQRPTLAEVGQPGGLVMSVVELEQMRRNRRERLWARPEEELWVALAQPSKGHVHESTIIFLHGMGEVAADSFMAVRLHKRFPNTRWVLPQAPDRPVTARDGKLHPAWFDIDRFPYDPNDRDDEGLFSSVRGINRVIAEERALLIRNLRRRGGGAALSSGPRVGEGYSTDIGPDGEDGHAVEFGTSEERTWASKRIVLAGFSQGSVVTLLAGLTHPEQLAGLVVFSGFLPLRENLSKLMIDLDRRDIPLFWGHGCEDPFLLFDDALTSASLLQPAAVTSHLHAHPSTHPLSTLHLTHPSYRLNLTQVTFKGYQGLEHSFDYDELDDVTEFLRGMLPKGVQRGERIPRDLGVIAQTVPTARDNGRLPVRSGEEAAEGNREGRGLQSGSVQ